MAGYGDISALSGITHAVHVASDIKDDRSGLLSVLSTSNIIATVLVLTVVMFLIVELVWRERRQHRREEQTEPTSEADPPQG